MSQFYSLKTLGVFKTKKETNPFLEHIWNENFRVLVPVWASGGECCSRRFWIQGLGPDLPSGQCQGGAKCPDWKPGEVRWGQVSHVPALHLSEGAIPVQNVFWPGIVSSDLKHCICLYQLIPISSFPDYPVNKQNVPRSQKTHPKPEVTPPARK